MCVHVNKRRPPPGLSELRAKREQLNQQIDVEQTEKTAIQNDLHILTERSARHV